MVVKQKTLAKSFKIEGKGLHTGVMVTMTFLPAPINHGFKFKRVDLEGPEERCWRKTERASEQLSMLLQRSLEWTSTMCLLK